MDSIEVRSVSWGGADGHTEGPESRDEGVSHEI